MFLALLKPFWPLIWRGLLILLAIGVAMYAWHRFTGHYIDLGVAQEHVHTLEQKQRADVADAANAGLVKDIAARDALIQKSNESIAALEKDEATRVAANAAGKAQLARELAPLGNEIARLQQRLAELQPTEEAAREIDSVLDQLSVHRRLRK